MSRTRTRTSRALIVVLILTIVIGVEEYNRHLRHLGTGHAAASAHDASHDVSHDAAAGMSASATPSPGPVQSSAVAAAPVIPSSASHVNDRGNATLLLAGSDTLRTQTPGASSGLAASGSATAGEGADSLSARAIPAAGIVAPAHSAANPASGAAGAATNPSASASPSQGAPQSTNPLADGKGLIDSGRLIEGRQMLNEALISGRLRGPDIATAKSLIQQANQTIIFSPRRFADDPFGGMMTVPPGGVLAKIAATNSTTASMLCRINNISDPRSLRANATLKLVHGPFFAIVTKSAFTMDLYLGAPGGAGSMFVASFPIGLGRDDSTPTGTWVVEPGHKLKNPTYYSPRGEGVIEAGDPKNPLGKYWIGLAGTDGQAVGKMSYGIHGNIDPDSIGKQSSMGCIRMRNEDVPLVYDMLIEGKSKVIVNP